MKASGRGRQAFSLVEVLMAIIIISVALVAVLNIFFYSLRLTVDRARNSSDLMASYAQVQQSFFVRDLKSSPSGVHATQVPEQVNLVFKGSGTLPETLSFSRYDIGEGKVLRVYRP